MTDHRLREILKTLRTERLRIEELIADFQMFAAESTLQKTQTEQETPVSTGKRRRRRPLTRSKG